MTFDDLKNEMELCIDDLYGEGSSLAALYPPQKLIDPVIRDQLVYDLALLSLRFQSHSAAVAVVTCQMGQDLSCDPLDVLCGYLELHDYSIIDEAAALAERLRGSYPNGCDYSVYDGDAVQRHFFGNDV